MNIRPVLRRKFYGFAVALATLGLLVGGTACSPPPQVGSQPGIGMAGGGQMKTLAVVVFNSYERLMGDVTFLGSLVDMPGIDQFAQANVLQAIGDKGLAAIDKTKPWGVILQTDGAGLSPLGAFPVNKADDLIAAIQANGIQINDRGNGLRDFTLPNGLTVFLKEQGGWLLFGQSAESFAQVPATLQADLTGLVANYNFAARIYVADVPDTYKGIAMMAMQSGFQQSLRQMPDESNPQFELRRQAAEANIQELSKFLEQADKLTLGVALDAKQRRAYFDVDIQAKPGTELAKQLAISGEPSSAFGGFYQANAAATMTFSNQIDPSAVPDVVAKMRANMTTMRQQLYAALESDENIPAGMRDALKLAADDFGEALISTAETGKMDSGAFVRVGPETLTVVGGARVKQPGKVVDGLKKLEAAAKGSTPGFTGIAWDAAQHGDVKFHTLNIPLPAEADPSFRRMVGDQLPVAIGVGPEAVYFAIGRDNIETVKQAIDTSRTDANKKVPPFEIAVSLAPILELAATNSGNSNMGPVLLNIATMLKNDAQGRDHLRVLGQVIEGGARYRFEAEEGALRALIQAAIAARFNR